MSYNYFVGIQGLKDKKWIQVDSNSYIGTYGSKNHHYFYTRIHDPNRINTIYRRHPDDPYQYSDRCHYLFSFPALQMDYLKYIGDYTPPDQEQIKELIMNDIGDVSIEGLIQLRDALTSIIDTYDNTFRSELTHYYSQCQELLSNYDDVRIIFGINP
jgi:hypothetical protein